MPTPTTDLLKKHSRMTMHDHTEADLGAVLDTRYVDLSGDQTVVGVKTFSSFPVTPSSAPTTNYQVANKKYVDDEISAIPGGVTDHGALTGLSDNDHTQYLLLAGGTMSGTLQVGTSPATYLYTTGVIDENRVERITKEQLEAQKVSYQAAIKEIDAKLAEISKL